MYVCVCVCVCCVCANLQCILCTAQLSSSIHKKVLVLLHSEVMPHLVEPRLLLDFLVDSYDTGIYSLHFLGICAFLRLCYAIYGLSNIKILVIFLYRRSGEFIGSEWTLYSHAPIPLVSHYTRMQSRHTCGHFTGIIRTSTHDCMDSWNRLCSMSSTCRDFLVSWTHSSVPREVQTDIIFEFPFFFSF